MINQRIRTASHCHAAINDTCLAMIITLFDDLPVPPFSLDDLFETDGLAILQFQAQRRIIETGVSHDYHITDYIADKRRHSDRLSESVQSFYGGLFTHDGWLIAFLRDNIIRKVGPSVIRPSFRMPNISCSVSPTCLLITIYPFLQLMDCPLAMSPLMQPTSFRFLGRQSSSMFSNECQFLDRLKSDRKRLWRSHL